MSSIEPKISRKAIQKYVKRLKEIFSLIWDSITTNYFFFEAEKYIDENKKELFNYIKFNILNSKIFNTLPILDDLKSEIDAIIWIPYFWAALTYLSVSEKSYTPLVGSILFHTNGPG